MPVTTYYFDASDAAPTDPNGVWGTTANAFDGQLLTSAFTTTNGSTSSNYLMAEGTNASAANTGIILQLRARIRATDDDADAIATTINAAIYTNGLAELLTTITLVTVIGQTYSSYFTLSTPTGGWTWQKISDLETKIYRTDTTSVKSLGVSILEIEVTTDEPLIPFRLYRRQGYQ